MRALRTLGRRLHEASAGLMVVGDRALAPLGVTSAQWKVLAMLDAEGPLRISELVSSLRLDQAATSRLVERLERTGLVTRQPSEEDRRGGHIVLTGEGTRTAARCRTVLEPLMQELTENLDEEGLTAFARALDAFASRIEALATRVPPRRTPRTPGRR